MGDLLFYDWPNGMRSIAGGTRGEINLSRAWQKEIEMNPKTSPFCPGKGQVLKELANGEWPLLQNRLTPYLFHEMVIPANCWSPDELRILGGEENVAVALRLIHEEIRNHPGKKLFVTAHIGTLAGQNVGHLHYHVMEYMSGDVSE